MEAAADDRLTVLYLIAKGRSGSNILAHFLGQLDGYCNTGELHHLWSWGLREGGRCGCGRSVPECELWSKVVANPELEGVDPATVYSGFAYSGTAGGRATLALSLNAKPGQF